MAIEIRNLCGFRRGEQTDAGIDGVYIVDPVNPGGRMVGIVGRDPGAGCQLVEPVSESVLKEIGAALDARDFDDLPDDKRAMATGQRTILAPPPELPDEGEDERQNEDDDED